jgi:hypothetical protein
MPVNSNAVPVRLCRGLFINIPARKTAVNVINNKGASG